MRILILASFLVALLPITQGVLSAQSISITEISPESPADLNFNDDITISFEYSFQRPEGVRIFIRPITSGKLTPNYAASGSPVYRGNGRGTATFTIRSGNVTVDQLRVQVLGSSQNERIFEFYLPVDYTYSSSPLTVVKPETVIHPKSLAVLKEALQTEQPADTSTHDSGEIEVIRRTVKPDGTIEIHYSDGSITGIISANDRYFVNPATGDTTYTKKLFSNVQGAGQPAAPPGLAVTSVTSVNEEWLNTLNEWVEYHGSQLLNRIGLYLEQDDLENYMTFEENNSSTIYEKVNLRYTFLEKLLGTLSQ